MKPVSGRSYHHCCITPGIWGTSELEHFELHFLQAKQILRDVLGWISEISTILGLWTFVGIIIFLILCWRTVSYVGQVVLFWYTILTGPSARHTVSATLAKLEARGRIQSIQDEMQSLRDGHPNIDGVNCQTLHNSILDREQWEELSRPHTLYTIPLTFLGVWVSRPGTKTVYRSASLLSFGPTPVCGFEKERMAVGCFATKTEK